MLLRVRLLFLAMLLCGVLEAKGPSVLYLTWIHDPTTTMTVQWHTTKADPVSKVSYRKVGSHKWQEQEGVYNRLIKTNLLVHTVELDQLEAGAEYEFSLVGKRGVFRFRTLPDKLSDPVKFVVGGDAYYYFGTFRKMNEKIAACDPDFVVVGGDIAYTNGRRAVFKGKEWEINRWRTFLKQWKTQMVTTDGRMIPMIPVVGNHDIKATALKLSHPHFLFYELFALPEKGVSFRTLDVGKYLSLFLLDTGHSFHIEGMQTDWLKKALSERESASYKMAAYHVGAYPSAYPFSGGTPRAIRAQWSPLFDQYHLNVAFEHHNHAYKRTHPLKGNEINPDGVIYMGDGSWGVNPRTPKKLWYMDNVASINAVCLVTLQPDVATVEALNIEGKIFDAMKTYPTLSEVAWNEGMLVP
jgi:acid phosphatase type 7